MVSAATKRQFAAATVLALGLSAPATALFAEGADADRPLIWHGEGAAAIVYSSIDTDPPLLPFEGLARGDVPEAQASWDATGRASARASEIWPGTLFAGGAGLLCTYGFPCPEGFPPDYAFTARAEHPARPDASSPGGFARARADGERVDAVASLTAHEGLEAFAALFRVGMAEARVHQEFADGVLTARAVSRLQGIELLDGLVTIEQLEVRSLSRTDGEAVTEDATTVSLKGVEVGGQSARITHDGIEILGQGDGGSLVDGVRDGASALADAFDAIGLDIRLVGTDTDTEPGLTRGQATGLLVTMEIPVEGQPLPGPAELPGLAELFGNLPPELPPPDPNVVYRTYQVSLTLGLARTSVFASNEGFGLDGLEDLADLTALPSPAGPPGFDEAPAVGQELTGPPSLGEDAAAGQPEARAAPGDNPAQAGFVFLGGEAAERLTTLYLMTLLVVGGLFAFSRFQARRST